MAKSSNVIGLSALAFCVVYTIFFIYWMTLQLEPQVPFISTVIFETDMFYPFLVAGFIISVYLVSQCQKTLSLFFILVTLSFYKQDHDRIHTLWALAAGVVGLAITANYYATHKILVSTTFVSAITLLALKIAYEFDCSVITHSFAAVFEHIFFFTFSVIVVLKLRNENN
jgi:hypothetical protein